MRSLALLIVLVAAVPAKADSLKCAAYVSAFSAPNKDAATPDNPNGIPSEARAMYAYIMGVYHQAARAPFPAPNFSSMIAFQKAVTAACEKAPDAVVGQVALDLARSIEPKP